MIQENENILVNSNDINENKEEVKIVKDVIQIEENIQQNVEGRNELQSEKENINNDDENIHKDDSNNSNNSDNVKVNHVNEGRNELQSEKEINKNDDEDIQQDDSNNNNNSENIKEVIEINDEVKSQSQSVKNKQTNPPKDEIINCKMISANANTILNAADYSETYSCLAYASSNLIHIYDPANIKTCLTLRGHKDRVNVVKWIDNHQSKNELIELLSCSSDGTIIHWINSAKEKNPFDYSSWKIEKIYSSNINLNSNNKSQKDLIQPVNLLHSLFISPIEKYFTVFHSDGKLDLYYFDIDLNEYKLFQSINFKKKLQDAICLTVLNDKYLMLLTGGYDTLINIYTVMRLKEINYKIQQKIEFSPIQFKLSLQGHVNDIRDIAAISPYVDNTDLDLNEFYFASCSQDSYIRVWHVIKLKDSDVMSMGNEKGSLSVFDEYKSKTSYVIKTEYEEYYNIILDSVLSGHEESVSSIRWGRLKGKNVLLSSSFDFTVGIWKYDENYNIWNKEVTLGEMSGNKHTFFSALFIDNCNSVIAYTYNGAFYYWKYNQDNKQFISQPIVHGHFLAVSDLDWDPCKSKAFLLTTSEDQTSRIFVNLKRNDTWHEVNRPQIHGYDVNTIALITQDREESQSYISKIVSGADEKIIRIFNAPFNLVKFIKNMAEVDLNFSKTHDNAYYEKHFGNTEGSKQALGLMTKGTRMDAPQEDEEAVDLNSFNPDEVLTNKVSEVILSKFDYSTPPDEDFLTNNTLWPEVSKLYGHGYEVISLAVSHNGKFIASGGKAQSEKHAKLFLWNADKNSLICKLDGHVLTIVQIEFSHDDEFILSVSRDRSICLYKRNDDPNLPYKLVQIEKETHGRIIWTCSWSSDSRIFVTGSRDMLIKIWIKLDLENNDKFYEELMNYEFKSAVTSVNVVPNLLLNDNYVLVVGLENGDILLFILNILDKICSQILSVHPFLTHAATVKRIKSFVTEDNQIRIASCSDDYSVRIFDVNLEKFKALI